MARLGIQGIIFGKRNGEDFEGVLRDVKAAGYDGIEIGYKANLTADELKGKLDEAGLLCAGYHASYDLFKDHDKLRTQAAQLVGVGGAFLMCSGTEGWREGDADAYRRSGEVFNAAGKLLKDEFGVTFCYHNHNWEFKRLATGERGMDLLLDSTDPVYVKLCLDVYWVACGGEEPAAYIRRHGGRCAYFHFKDGTYDAREQEPKTFTELGRGMVDLRDAALAALEQNPPWIVTEQDRTDGDPAESARISAEYARDTLRVHDRTP